MTPVLELIRGADNTVEVLIVDDVGRPEDLTEATEAKMVIKRVGTVNEDTVANLSLDIAEVPGTLTVEMQMKFGDELYSVLEPERYVADVSVTYGTELRATERFFVDVTDALSGDHE